MIKKLLLILLILGLVWNLTPNYYKYGHPRNYWIYSEHLDGTEKLIKRTDLIETWEKTNGQRVGIYEDKIKVYPNTTTTYYPDEDDIDGYIWDGGACGRTAHNDGTLQYGYLGCDGTVRCLTDDSPNKFRFYSSHATGDIGEGTVTDADYTYYIEVVNKSKGALPTNCALNYSIGTFIGDALVVADWGAGGAVDATGACHITVGAKTKDIGNAHINTNGDTDFELSYNVGFLTWYSHCYTDGKKLYWQVATVEDSLSARRPKLVVVYDPAEKRRMWIE